MKKIKLYGERNTGTNYLMKLLALNFEVSLLRGTVPRAPKLPLIARVNNWERYKDSYFDISGRKNLGWKHTYLNTDLVGEKLEADPDLNILLLVKNPYSFLLSLHKKPYHNRSKSNLSFDEFLETEWQVYKRENLKENVLNPIVLWNLKTNIYLELKDKYPSRVMLVKYEDLVSDPKSLLESMSDFFDLKFVGAFNNYEKSTKSKSKDFAYYAEYYLKELWREKLSSKSIELINNRLDHSVRQSLGYDLLESKPKG